MPAQRRVKLMWLAPNTTAFEPWREESHRRLVDADLDFTWCPEGPPWCAAFAEEYLVYPHMLRNALNAQEQGYDAAIVGSNCDPCLDGLREQLDMLVIGPGEASYALAGMVSNRFAMLTSDNPGLKPMMERSCERLGLRDKMTGVRLMKGHAGFTASVTPGDFERVMELTQDVVDECKAAKDEDGADCVIIGATTYDALGISQKVKDQLSQIPGYEDLVVIESTRAALNMAKALVETGVSQSHLSFPKLLNKAWV
jgi:allantoin racemase